MTRRNARAQKKSPTVEQKNKNKEKIKINIKKQITKLRKHEDSSNKGK